MSMRELLEKADDAKVICEIGGVKIVSFDDAVALAYADHKNDVGLSPVEFNPDGTIASTPTKYAAVNEEMFFDNRYRVVKGEYQVVCGFKDYLVIKGQSTGRVPNKQVICDVIVPDDEGKPQYKTTVTVTDAEFVKDFTNKFSREDMVKILPLLVNDAKRELSEQKSIFK